MQEYTYIKRRFRGSQWLLMALLCVVFSGAVKKLIQLHADQKIGLITHTEKANARLVSQNIKDGHRERHEFFTIILSGNRQIPSNGFEPTSHSALQDPCSILINIYNWNSTVFSYKTHHPQAFNSVPAYLLFRNFRV